MLIFSCACANLCAMILVKQEDYPERGEEVRSGRTKWSSLCAEISGKNRDLNICFFKKLNHCQPEKSLHKYVIVGLMFINF